MKRLSALSMLAILITVLAPTLHAQERTRQPSDTMRLSQSDPAAPVAPFDTNRTGISRTMLAGGARTAARTARLRNDERLPSEQPPASAPSGTDTVIGAGPGRSRALGVGFVATLPTAGVSAIVNLSSHTAAQGLLGIFFAGLKTVTGRYLYYFRETTNFQPYLYGELGAWSYDNQVVLGFGGGAGLEYFIERYPFVSLSFEFTLREIGFAADVYDISGLAVGGGVHYYF
jgi:hypothetical protein